MPRLQFSLKSLLWLMVVVGSGCAAWQSLKPYYRFKMAQNNSVDRRYVWRNGLSLTIYHDGFELPTITIETGVDTSRWDD